MKQAIIREVLEKDKNFKSELVYDGFHKIKKITRKSKEKEIGMLK